MKLVLEPIFEADFFPCSYGFRPNRRAHDAVAEVHHFASRSYEWVVEGDIKACFDEISHPALMDRVRKRVGDKRVLDLVKAFLKAGILDEDGTLHHISSEHVNAYLRDCSGHHITAKDFRTWAATNLAVLEMVPLREAKPTKRAVAGVVKRVAEQLGNTPAVCRKSYIHPRVLACYLDGSLKPTLAMIATSIRAPELYAVEGVVMRLLREWTAADKLIGPTLAPRQQPAARAS